MSSHITNILDIGKEQKVTKSGFDNFFNSTDNSILFSIYDNIKKSYINKIRKY